MTILADRQGDNSNFPEQIRLKATADGRLLVAVDSSVGGSSGASLADNMVVDAAGIYWIVRDSGSALTYVKLSTGITGTPTAPLRPLTDRDPVQFTYKVNTAFTDTAVTGSIPVGALLVRIAWLDTTGSAPSAAFSSWFYKGTALAAAPLDANIDFIDASSGGTTKTSQQVQYQVSVAFGTLTVGTILTKVSLFDTSSTGSMTIYWFKQTGVAVIPADVALIVEGTNVINQSEQVDMRMLDSTGALITKTNPFPVANTASADVTGTNNLLVGTGFVDIAVKDYDQFVFTATYNNFSGNNTYAGFVGSSDVYAVVGGVPQKIQFYDASKNLQVSLDGFTRTGAIRTAEIDAIRFQYSITAGSITLNWAKKSKASPSVVIDQTDCPAIIQTIAALNGVAPIELFGATTVTSSVLALIGVSVNAGIIFQCSPNSTNGTDGNWFNVQAARSDSNTADSQINVTSLPTYYSEFSTKGMRWARVKCVSLSGTTPAIQLALKRSYGNAEPVPVTQAPGTQQVTFPGSLNLTAQFLSGSTFAANTSGTVSLQQYSTFDSRGYFGSATVPVGVTLSLTVQEAPYNTNAKYTNRFALPDILGTGASVFFEFPPIKGQSAYSRLAWTVTGASAVTGVNVYLKESPYSYPVLRGDIFKGFALNSGTSATAALYAPDCSKFEFGVMGYTIAAAASIQLQTSQDGTSWVAVGTPYAIPTGSNISTRQSVMDFLGPYVRLVVTTPSGNVTSSGQAFIRAME